MEYMPTWVYTLANHIPEEEGIALDFYDTRFDKIEDVKEARVFLYSGINQDLDELLRVSAEISAKFPNSIAVIGGPICWSFNESGDLDLLKDFDHIVVGDGEEIIGDIVVGLKEGKETPSIIINTTRFKLSEAKSYYEPFVSKKLDRYHGVVIEVSRGCPFLCEFCDIRIIPDNNKTHVKSPDHLVAEIEYYIELGKTQIILACDNIIGDLPWIDEFLDKMIEMVERLGTQPNVFTWSTINLAKMPHLLKKMRLAGFHLLFIGIESFNVNTLMETAKIQNTKRALTDDIKVIQSYGFIIVAGIIFGFDTENEDCFDVALDGINESGLLSGDPHFLTALPGTPLYRRMQLSNRLRSTSDQTSSFSTGGKKYISNIKFVISKDKLIHGFLSFVERFNQRKFQLARLKSYYRNIMENDNYIPLGHGNDGFANLGDFFKSLLKDDSGFKQLYRRLYAIVRTPLIIYSIIEGLLYVVFKVKMKGKYNHYIYWVFSWSNYLMKYWNLKESDFDIDSVKKDFDLEQLIPEDYASSATEQIPVNKINSQIKATISGLRSFIDRTKQ